MMNPTRALARIGDRLTLADAYGVLKSAVQNIKTQSEPNRTKSQSSGKYYIAWNDSNGTDKFRVNSSGDLEVRTKVKRPEPPENREMYM